MIAIDKLEINGVFFTEEIKGIPLDAQLFIEDEIIKLAESLNLTFLGSFIPGNKNDPKDKLFTCSRCSTKYAILSGSIIGCCVSKVGHRTSGVCGGELVVVI